MIPTDVRFPTAGLEAETALAWTFREPAPAMTDWRDRVRPGGRSFPGPGRRSRLRWRDALPGRGHYVGLAARERRGRGRHR